MPDYDVAIVGGSLAGSAAAVFLAREGARVAVLEKSPNEGAYKKVCTHYIQASATPVLERLGLTGEIEAAGGLRNPPEFWTRYGWVRPKGNGAPLPEGYNIRRERLDPMLRKLATSTPGVDYLGGTSATGLLRDADGRPAGVEAGDTRITAKLVVGADGRGSKVARWAAVPGRVKPHNRFAYFAYFSGLDPATSRSRLWLLDPDTAYQFPNDDGLTVFAVLPHRDRLGDFKRDAERSLRNMIRGLPDAPPIDDAEQVGPLLGKLDMTNVSRPAAAPGVAFVGDAALATDPLWGVGCGFALQSAEWLADDLAGALQDGDEDVDAALDRYRRRHRKALGAHHFLIADYASGRPFSPPEKLMFSSAARDPEVARLMHRFGSRLITPAQLFSPRNVARMVRAAAGG